ncbi:MAG: TonB-dependent receptor plug domain-containing protein [Saprospiraceae bacterium]|nr:TonB-dependent receptor plug domain-containing protein [Saprospiraceae bacterium]
MRWLLFFIVLLTVVEACNHQMASTSVTTKQRHADIRRMQMENAENLAEYLKTQPGVIVSGHFGNYSIRLMGGGNTFQSGTEPLMIVDGVPFGSSFNELVSFVNMKDVQKIEILRDPTSLASYGSRGANGVIKIVMK